MPQVPYSRPLSPVERVWAVGEYMSAPFVIQLVLEGVGSLDVSALRAAVESASEANPGVRVRLKGALGWSRWVDAGDAPAVREVDGSGWNGRTPAGAPFLSDPLPLTGPTTEVLIVRGSPDRLVVRTHHACMDGRGHQLFCQDLFRALRNEPLVGSRSVVTDLDIAHTLAPGAAPTRDGDQLAVTGPSDADAPVGTVWARVTARGTPSKVIPRVLCSLAEQARRHGDGEVRIDLPVDLRRHLAASSLDATPSIANLTGMLHLSIGPEDAPVQLAHRIQMLLAERREAEFVTAMKPLRALPLWVMGWFGSQAATRQHRSDRWLSSAVASTLGRLDLSTFCAPGFTCETAFYIPPATEGTALILVLCGTPAGVEICGTAPARLASKGRLEACLNELAAAIVRPADPPPAG